MALTIEQLNAMPDNPNWQAAFAKQVQTPQPKKNSGLLSLLPSAAAAAASFIPGVGTVAGGLIGGAGEAGRQLLSGEKLDWGKVGTEAALSAIPFGIGKIGKVVKGVKGAIAAGEGVAGAARATRDAAMPLTAARRATTTGEAATNTPTMFSKFKSSARDKSQEGYGLTVGQSAGRGKVLTPDSADEIYDFINKGSQKYGGIRAGKPIDQARDAQNVHNNVVKLLDETLTKINRPVSADELTGIGANISAKIGANTAVTGKGLTSQKFATKIANAKDVKELEAIRREADNLAFTSTGAGKTSAAAQARDVRDAIDEFITPLSAEYKAIKGDYTLSRDALDAISKANKNAKGIKIPFVEVEVGKQSKSGVMNKASAAASGTQGSGSLLNKVKTGAKFTGELAKQGVTRAIAYPTINADEVVPQDGNAEIPAGTSPVLTDPSLSATPSAQNDPTAGIDAAIQQALAAGDYKGLGALMSVAEYYDKKNGATTSKPLSAEASKIISNAQTGIQALNDFERSVSSDPNVLAKRVIPGRDALGGVIGGALGTRGADAAANQIVDVIARLRTGAAITNDEAKRFEQFIPTIGDSPEVAQQKLGYLRNQFEMVANRSGSAGTDLQAAVGY